MDRTRRPLAVIASVLALLILAATTLPIAAQPAPAPAPPGTPIFGEEVEVRVVNVEVVVTDKQGNRVIGLTPKDFRLRVDGREVPVQYFSEVHEGQAVVPSTETAGTASSPAEPPSVTPGKTVGTSYLVVIDDYFAFANQRNTVLASIRDQVDRLGPDDRMAIVAYDGRKLTMLSSWSGSPRDLKKALIAAMERPAHGVDRATDLRTFESGRHDAPTLGSTNPVIVSATTSLHFDEIGYARLLGQQVERAATAAASTLRAFAQPPGRKVMLLLSGGWPYSTQDYMLNNDRPILSRDVPEGDKLLKPLVSTANLLGYTIYPVDVPGIEPNPADVQNEVPMAINSERKFQIQQSLQFTAKETGGRALLNSKRVDVLATAAADTTSYYWLGFTPDRKRDDKRHEVKVEVLRPGLTARARDSFFDLSRSSEVSMQVESAILFGNPAGTSGMPMRVGKITHAGRGTMKVPLTLGLPVDRMTVLPLHGKYSAEVELRAAGLNDRGERSDIPVVPVVLTSEKAPAPNGHVRYDVTLTMRAVPQHLVVAIYDPPSGKVTLAETDVKPEK
ncbi:MAG TPA: VWA domain-containing protein [Thermoanaerobaculia bacterium]|nr:VWA domain-containing protein [Thermoanaerobaculia bacterium]